MLKSIKFRKLVAAASTRLNCLRKKQISSTSLSILKTELMQLPIENLIEITDQSNKIIIERKLIKLMIQNDHNLHFTFMILKKYQKILNKMKIIALKQQTSL
jgi:hypothetical protein